MAFNLYFTASIFKFISSETPIVVRATDEVDFEAYYNSPTGTTNTFRPVMIDKITTGVSYPVWRISVPSIQGKLCIYPKKKEDNDATYYVLQNYLLHTTLDHLAEQPSPYGILLFPYAEYADNSNSAIVLVEDDGRYFAHTENIKVPYRINYSDPSTPGDIDCYTDGAFVGLDTRNAPILKLEEEAGDSIELATSNTGYYEIPANFPWYFGVNYRIRLYADEDGINPYEFMDYNPFNEWMTGQDMIFRLSNHMEYPSELAYNPFVFCPLSVIGFIDSSVTAYVQSPTITNSEFNTAVEQIECKGNHGIRNYVDIAYVSTEEVVKKNKFKFYENSNINYSAIPLLNENGANNLFNKYVYSASTLTTLPSEVTANEIIYSVPTHQYEVYAKYYTLHISQITNIDGDYIKNVSWKPVYTEDYNCEHLSGNTFFADSIYGGFKMNIPFVNGAPELSGITISRHGYNSKFIPFEDFYIAGGDHSVLTYNGDNIQLQPEKTIAPANGKSYLVIANQKKINDTVNEIYGHTSIDDDQPGIYKDTPFNNFYDSNEYYPCVTEGGNLPLDCFESNDGKLFSSILVTGNTYVPIRPTVPAYEYIPLKDIEIAGCDSDYICLSIEENRDSDGGVSYGLRYNGKNCDWTDNVQEMLLSNFGSASPTNQYQYFLSLIHNCKRANELQLSAYHEDSDAGMFFNLMDDSNNVIAVSNPATYDKYWFNLQDYFLYNKTVQANIGEEGTSNNKTICRLNNVRMEVKRPISRTAQYGIKFILLESPFGNGDYKYDLYAYSVNTSILFINLIVLDCDKFKVDEEPTQQFVFMPVNTTSIGNQAKFLHSEIYHYQIKQIHPRVVMINNAPNPPEGEMWKNLVIDGNNPDGAFAFTFQWGINEEDERYFLDSGNEFLYILPTEPKILSKDAQEFYYTIFAKESFAINAPYNWINVSPNKGKRGVNVVLCSVAENTSTSTAGRVGSVLFTCANRQLPYSRVINQMSSDFNHVELSKQQLRYDETGITIAAHAIQESKLTFHPSSFIAGITGNTSHIEPYTTEVIQVRLSENHNSQPRECAIQLESYDGSGEVYVDESFTQLGMPSIIFKEGGENYCERTDVPSSGINTVVDPIDLVNLTPLNTVYVCTDSNMITNIGITNETFATGYPYTLKFHITNNSSQWARSCNIYFYEAGYQEDVDNPIAVYHIVQNGTL